MANIQAFRGIRYDLSQVGSLADVIAPPYDVIDQNLQNQLYSRHPANVVRLILNREEPGDEPDAKYARAAKFLRTWKQQGVLMEESEAAIYVYHQIFQDGDSTLTRRGFLTRCRLERFGEGNIFPHEQTHSGPKVDRLKLTRACQHNLSPIFGIYPDDSNQAQEILEKAIQGTAPLEATDHLGVIHRMWVVTDTATITAVQRRVGPKPIFIADGHHRYETALNYRDELAAKGPLSDDHPANYVLMMMISMSDPGMIVLPTHRLFRGVEPIGVEALKAKLEPAFAVEVLGQGPHFAQELWEEIEIEGAQGTLGIYSRQDDRWLRVRITDEGRSRLAAVASNQSTAWRALGVSILHQLLLPECLGLRSLTSPKYVHDVPEVIEGLKHGDTAGRDATGQLGSQAPFELAVLVRPASVEDVRTISLQGERMPAKSTYFFPKLLSGLVFNPVS